MSGKRWIKMEAYSEMGHHGGRRALLAVVAVTALAFGISWLVVYG